MSPFRRKRESAPAWSIGHERRAKWHVFKQSGTGDHNGDTQGQCGHWFVQSDTRKEYDPPPEDQTHDICWKWAKDHGMELYEE